jgi:hypothetical protein
MAETETEIETIKYSEYILSGGDVYIQCRLKG